MKSFAPYLLIYVFLLTGYSLLSASLPKRDRQHPVPEQVSSEFRLTMIGVPACPSPEEVIVEKEETGRPGSRREPAHNAQAVVNSIRPESGPDRKIIQPLIFSWAGLFRNCPLHISMGVFRI